MPRQLLFLVLFTSLCLLAGCTAGIDSPSPESPTPIPFAARLHHPEAWSYYYFAQSRLLGDDGALEQAEASLDKAMEFDPDDAYLSVSLARLRLEQRNVKGAIQALESALVKDASLVDAYLLLGGIYYSQRQFEQAIKPLSEAVRLAPERELSYLHLGLAYIGNGELQRAVDTFEQMLKVAPDSIPARLNLARAYRQLELGSRAGDYYRDVLRIAPHLLVVYLEYGDLLEKQRDDGRAEDLYRSGLEQIKRKGPLYHRLARLLVKQQRFKEALEFLRLQQVARPDDLEAWRKAGLIYLELKNWDLAAKSFRYILKRRSDLPQIHYYLGTALEQQEEWPDALEAFNAVPDDSNLFGDALYHRSYLNHQLGHNDRAVKLLRELIDRGSARAEFYDYLASLQNDAGDRAAALRVVNEGLKKFPDDVDLLYHRGVLEEQSGDRAAAMLTMQQLITVDPDHVEAMNFVAYGFAEENRNLPQALRLVQKALQLKRAPHILDTLGWVYYRLGRLQEARQSLEEAVQGLAADPVVLEHLGDVYRALGLKDQAADMYSRALKAAPETSGLREKLQQVRPQ